jgi:hypothetical protein
MIRTLTVIAVCKRHCILPADYSAFAHLVATGRLNSAYFADRLARSERYRQCRAELAALKESRIEKARPSGPGRAKENRIVSA